MQNLTKQDIEIIKSSYQTIRLQEGYLAERFYQTLFRRAPEARGLFPDNITGQMEKFSDTLDFLVNNLSTPWMFTGKIKRLARRHVKYGATPEHYKIVGEALIEALRNLSPVPLTHEEEIAWIRLYGGISHLMIETAYPDAA